MPPELLRSVVQNWNKIRALNFYSKSANRGESFKVLNADDVVAAYGKSAMKRPAPKVEVDDDDYSGVRRIPLCKAASAVIPLEEPIPEYVCRVGDLEPEKVAAWRQELDTEFALKESAASLRGTMTIVLADMEKVATAAADLLRGDAARLRRIEEALWFDDGERKYAHIFDIVAGLAAADGYAPERAKKAFKRLISDNELYEKLAHMHTLDGTLSELMAGLLDVEQALEKAAAVAAEAPKTKMKPQAKSDYSPDDKPSHDDKRTMPTLRLPSDAKVVMEVPNIPESPVAPGNMLGELLQRSGILPSQNTRQMSLDNLLNDHRRSLVLTRLMLTDPVISQADPEEVADAFESVSRHAPDVANDVHAMRSAIREQLQYGSMPLGTVKELAGVQKTKDEIAGREAELRQQRYRV